MTARGRRGGLLLVGLLLLAGNGGGAVDPLPAGLVAALATSAASADAGERVAAISAGFLGTPYRAATLGGGAGLPEPLVMTLDAVDCFTLLDYVEALRRCRDPGEFRDQLVAVRYRGGVIAWEHRRHFFTDWLAAPAARIVDVTEAIGGGQTRRVDKRLNLRDDGTLYLPGVAIQERTIRYLPPAALDPEVLGRLRPGDYLGIYAPEPGLDVSHVGIVVRRDGQLFLRHASSRRAAAQVVDSDLRAYLAGTPGVVILRPR